jgi:hypothetical protein
MIGQSCGSKSQELPDYPDYVRRLKDEDAALAEEIVAFWSIEQVLQWMQQRSLLRTPVDMVGQDEFNYDFLLELEPAGRWLHFGVN